MSCAWLPAAERFVLSGLVVLDDGDGSAWVQEPTLTRNEIVRVRRGDTIGSWRITRILDDRIVLENPAGSVTYVILSGATSPDVDPQSPRGRNAITSPSGAPPDRAAAEARLAARALATGGDEGVWDDEQASPSPVAAPGSSPAVAPALH